MSTKKPNFEDGMRRLEQIVRAMENGDVALDESLKLFKEGTDLVAHCNKLLEEAEMQVKIISTNTDGQPIQEDFQYE